MTDFSALNIVGLTGMSGAGKTTVCHIFAENGYNIIDCDLVSRKVSQKGTKCLMEIGKAFPTAIGADGEMNRRALGAEIFSDEQKRVKLMEITYPYITYDIISSIVQLSNQSERLFVIDAPTLFESGMESLCGSIVSVVADIEICARRIMKRDGITEKAAHDRLSSQHNKDYYIEKSNYYIENNENENEMYEAARAVINKLGRTQ